MTVDQLARMGLDPARFSARIEFLLGYAATARDELESLSSAPVADNKDDLWLLRADYATALREAGQLCMMLDPPRAIELLRQASTVFIELGAGFGLFLNVLADGESDTTAELLDDALAIFPYQEPRDGYVDREVGHHFLTEPQQSAYILISAVCNRRIARRHERLLLSILQDSPQRSGVLPVGALGTPIHRYWAIARSIIEQKTPTTLVTHINAMCAAYDEAVQLAQTNTHLWENCSAPIDLVDIDIVGILALTVRSFGHDLVTELFSNHRGLDRVSSTQIDIGFEMAQRL
ncbi:hypothetical protein [Nocardia sp. NPDC050175]|uniref:hypothetical protein n=1 Tax=Nocardia sp. NPDC050175 TaxID=3364317 RepID=UPI0037A55CAB